MANAIDVLKNEEHQVLVPTLWRSTFEFIVESFSQGDYLLSSNQKGVKPISKELATTIKRNIEDYGEILDFLHQESWDTSVCQWMLEYWEVYIDLYTMEAGRSDLVLAVRVYEDDESYIFEVQSVHIP